MPNDTVTTESNVNGSNGRGNGHTVATSGAVTHVNPTATELAIAKLRDEESALAVDQKTMATRTKRMELEARFQAMQTAGSAVAAYQAALLADPKYAKDEGARLVTKAFLKTIK